MKYIPYIIIGIILFMPITTATVYEYQSKSYYCNNGQCTKVQYLYGADREQCDFLFSLINVTGINKLKCYKHQLIHDDIITEGKYFYDTKSIYLYDVDGKNTQNKVRILFHELKHHEQNQRYSLKQIKQFYKLNYYDNPLEIEAMKAEGDIPYHKDVLEKVKEFEGDIDGN